MKGGVTCTLKLAGDKDFNLKSTSLKGTLEQCQKQLHKRKTLGGSGKHEEMEKKKRLK